MRRPHLRPTRHLYAVASIFACWVTPVNAQPAPHLEGRIEIAPIDGTLKADLCYSGLPKQANLAFLLNRGLNIREVRDTATGKALAYSGYINAQNMMDATRYTVEEAPSADGFCVSYSGLFPVYRVDKGERSVDDWKGQIAFDGKTIRASEQTRFYPVPLGQQLEPLEDVSYRLQIVCENCRSIYLNGSPPARGPRATFDSDTPRPLLLYAGQFPYTVTDGAYFIGSDISKADSTSIQAGLKLIAEAHVAYLGLEYLERPSFLTFAATSRDRVIGETRWAFVTWPTVAMDGRVSFSKLLDSNVSPPALAAGVGNWMGHEMAHYYFGTRYQPRGPLFWFLLESTAEFLALKSLHRLQGAPAFNAALSNYYQSAVAAGPVIPLDQIGETEQVGENYRYKLGPLLLMALERRIGEETLKTTLSRFVTEPPNHAVNYASFRQRLVAAGASLKALAAFESDCLKRNLENSCLKELVTDSVPQPAVSSR